MLESEHSPNQLHPCGTMRPFLKQSAQDQPIASSYYHTARNMRGRYYSRDAIRRVLIRKGLSWEKSFAVVDALEAEAEMQIYRHPFAPRNRSDARRRLLLLGSAFIATLIIPYCDSLPGVQVAFCSGISIVLALALLISLIFYGVFYMMY